MPLVHVVPLHHPYLLLIPKAFEGYPHLDIYSFDPSNISNRRICTLHLSSESIEPDEHVVWHEIHTGDRPYTSQGHFHADLSLSIVALTFYIRGPQGEHESHYLIPRATFLAQIRAAESQQTVTDGGKLDSEAASVSIPWTDWGPQGCLRLRLSSRVSRSRRALLIPFGARMPMVVFDGPDSKSASVFVFDIGPLSARRRRQVLAVRRDGSMPELNPGPESTSGIVANIEVVLPGVVDPDCSSIPYVAYRFELPYDPAEWQFGHMVRSVAMSMTGFTVKVSVCGYYLR